MFIYFMIGYQNPDVTLVEAWAPLKMSWVSDSIHFVPGCSRNKCLLLEAAHAWQTNHGRLEKFLCRPREAVETLLHFLFSADVVQASFEK